jgi:hypothetical protein
MDDPPHDIALEIEATNAIIVLRLRHVFLNREEAIDRFIAPVQRALAEITEPHYVLLDITGLVISPRMRTYLLARGRGMGPRVQAVLIFTRSDPLTELVLSTSLMYGGVPCIFCPDEAAARAQVAALRGTARDLDQLA